MKQIKIFKKIIGTNVDFGVQVEELQKEVNNYIRTNGYVYDPIYKRYLNKGQEITKITPLLNGVVFIIVLEIEAADIIE